MPSDDDVRPVLLIIVSARAGNPLTTIVNELGVTIQ